MKSPPMPSVRQLFTPFAAAAETITIDSELCDRARASPAGPRVQAGYRRLPRSAQSRRSVRLRRSFQRPDRGDHARGPGPAGRREGSSDPARRRGGAAPHAGVHRPGRPHLRRPRTRRSTCDRPAERTTPIWLSSFGVFFEELDGGENFTASHSQSYKGGWKPMDAAGGQLLEMAGQIADRVRDLVAEAGDGRHHDQAGRGERSAHPPRLRSRRPVCGRLAEGGARAAAGGNRPCRRRRLQGRFLHRGRIDGSHRASDLRASGRARRRRQAAVLHPRAGKQQPTTASASSTGSTTAWTPASGRSTRTSARRNCCATANATSSSSGIRMATGSTW